MVYIIESSEDFEKLTQVSKSSLVFFTGRYCNAAKSMNKKFVKMAKKSNGSIKFLVVDVDQFDELANRANVTVIPTFHLYKDGVLVDQLIGADEDMLEEMINKVNG